MLALLPHRRLVVWRDGVPLTPPEIDILARDMRLYRRHQDVRLIKPALR